MCILTDNRDNNDQQTPDLEYGDSLFSNDSDYFDVGELSPTMFPSGNLNIIQLNVRGLLSKQSRINELIGKIEKSLELHALVLCETWLTPDTQKLLKINNYSYSGIERTGKKVVVLAS